MLIQLREYRFAFLTAELSAGFKRCARLRILSFRPEQPPETGEGLGVALGRRTLVTKSRSILVRMTRSPGLMKPAESQERLFGISFRQWPQYAERLFIRPRL